MEIPVKIEYKGRKYYLQSTKRYYQDGYHGKNPRERLLHRVIWIEHFGDIPEGMEVHHKNEDWTDNNPGNLELLSKSDHQRLHCQKRYSDPVELEKLKASLPEAREAAKLWHKSPEGRAWHKMHAKDIARKMYGQKNATLKCKECGIDFEGFSSNPATFCSGKCRQRDSLKNGASGVDVQCPGCGLTWRKNKHSGSKTNACSWKCRRIIKASNFAIP